MEQAVRALCEALDVDVGRFKRIVIERDALSVEFVDSVDLGDTRQWSLDMGGLSHCGCDGGKHEEYRNRGY